MHMKKQKIDMSRLSVLQKEQVNRALAHGLDIQDVKCFAKPCYNFKEMEEIRLFLERGGKDFRYQNTIKKKQSVTGWAMKAFLGFLVVVAVACMAALFSFLLARPSLILTAKNCEIEKGDTFDAMQYISSWSNLDGTLYLPKNIDTSIEGTHLAVYRLEAKGEIIVETLHIVVK